MFVGVSIGGKPGTKELGGCFVRVIRGCFVICIPDQLDDEHACLSSVTVSMFTTSFATTSTQPCAWVVLAFIAGLNNGEGREKVEFPSFFAGVQPKNPECTVNTS